MDKLWHLLAGMAISICFGFIHPFLGLFFGIAAGIWKECYDLTIKKTYVSYKDIIFTAIGAFIGFAIIILISE